MLGVFTAHITDQEVGKEKMQLLVSMFIFNWDDKRERNVFKFQFELKSIKSVDW